MDDKTKLTHLNVILNVMCLCVGANYNDIDMKEDDWYFKHTWDEQTENEFKNWFVEYIHKVKGAQLELCGAKYLKKHECERAVDMFILQFGWRTKYMRADNEIIL